MDWLFSKLLVCLCMVTIFASKLVRKKQIPRSRGRSVSRDTSCRSSTQEMETSETIASTLPESNEEINIEALKTQLKNFIFCSGRQDRLTAGLVRLAFHDCVGGCDGCINLNNPHNSGLEPYITDMNVAYTTLKLPPGLSRADFWILGAIVAIENTLAIGSDSETKESDMTDTTKTRDSDTKDSDMTETTKTRDSATMDSDMTDITKTRGRHVIFKRSVNGQSNSLNLVFKEGRVDCDTSPSTTDMHHFPNPMDQLDPTVEFFQKEFGFDQNETIALLGAHTLGKCILQNTGFVGPWVGGYQRFNNDYYKAILNTNGLDWRQVNKGNKTDPRWQWDSEENTMMLNIDMGLAYHMKWAKRKEPGKTACKLHVNKKKRRCLDSAGKDLVVQYANDNKKWLEDFSAVFNKMINHGCSDHESKPCGAP